MATVFLPNGLNEAGYLLGAKPRGASYDFPIASGTADFFGSGEPVALSGGYIVSVAAATAYPPAASDEIILGVFQNVLYQPAQSSPPGTAAFWASGTTTFNSADGAASINTDPYVIYNVQANGSVAQSSIGLNFNLAGFNNPNSNNIPGSQVYLNATSLSVDDNWGQVKLIGLAPGTPASQVAGGNNWGDAYTIVQVVLNSTVFKFGQYGV